MLLKKCTAEFIGTFALVFAGCGAVIANQITGGAVTHVGIALTFGFTIMVMVYALGNISGAHFNPAVTIGLCATKHHSEKEAIPYILAQCGGAALASGLHCLLLKPILKSVNPVAVLDFGVTQPIDGAWSTAFMFEIILTFFLVFVIVAVATNDKVPFACVGLAIGGTIVLDALFGGPITGGSMNPARSFGPALVSGNWSLFTAYIAGPIVGGILGALSYEYVRN